MKIVVIGSRGMLGRDLLPILSEKYKDVISLGKDTLDITHKESTLSIIKDLRPDLLIHAAAFTNVDDCEKEKDHAFLVNRDGAAHVAEGCRVASTKMIYISTDYVFDGTKGKAYTEDDRTNPLGMYGKSKLAGESVVQGILNDSVIIRTSWLFGMNGKNFVTAILKGANEKPQLDVVNDQIASPTFTPDLSHAIVQLIEKKVRGIIHVANSGECSWYLYAKKILEFSGQKGCRVVTISSSRLCRPAPRPTYSLLHCEKFESITGVAMRPWEEALKEYIDSLS